MRSGYYSLPVDYVQAVRRAGGVAVIIPPGDDDPRAGLARLDGIILSGGGDIEPRLYGAQPHPEVYGIDQERDAFEIALARAAAEDRVPMLAICRGIQVVNIALGGDLVQHLPDVTSGAVQHRTGSASGTRHRVRIAADSHLAAICRAQEVVVQSWHHQAPRLLGKGLRAVAWADDGTVEAVESSDHPALVAVQWHPEETAETDPAQQRLFDWLVSTCFAAETFLKR